MFIRVDNVLINLDEIHTAILDNSLQDSLPILKLQMRGGIRTTVGHGADPEVVFDVMVAALAEAGQLYTPAEPDPPIEMSDLELGFLMQADDEGYKYIARDRNGQLFAYKDEPHKDGPEWMTYAPAAEPERMCDELFDFVDFDDDEPTKIAELLGR